MALLPGVERWILATTQQPAGQYSKCAPSHRLLRMAVGRRGAGKYAIFALQAAAILLEFFIYIGNYVIERLNSPLSHHDLRSNAKDATSKNDRQSSYREALSIIGIAIGRLISEG